MASRERRQKRVPLYGMAEVKAGSNGPRFLCKALTQTVSRSGMGLYMRIPLKVGTPVSITIRYMRKDGKRPIETVEGTVASVSLKESFCCVGIRFNRYLNAKDQPYLYPHTLANAEEQVQI